MGGGKESHNAAQKLTAAARKASPAQSVQTKPATDPFARASARRPNNKLELSFQQLGVDPTLESILQSRIKRLQRQVTGLTSSWLQVRQQQPQHTWEDPAWLHMQRTGSVPSLQTIAARALGRNIATMPPHVRDDVIDEAARSSADMFAAYAVRSLPLVLGLLPDLSCFSPVMDFSYVTINEHDLKTGLAGPTRSLGCNPGANDWEEILSSGQCAEQEGAPRILPLPSYLLREHQVLHIHTIHFTNCCSLTGGIALLDALSTLPHLSVLGLGNAFSTLAGPVLTALAFASHPLPALKELDMSDAKLLEARDMIDAAYRLRVLTELRVRRCPLFKADELRVYPRFINVYV